MKGTCTPFWERVVPGQGDDILFASEEKFVDEIFDKLKGEMILKKRAKLGFVERDDKHCTTLNRLIGFTVNESGPIILHEPDPTLRAVAGT